MRKSFRRSAALRTIGASLSMVAVDAAASGSCDHSVAIASATGQQVVAALVPIRVSHLSTLSGSAIPSPDTGWLALLVGYVSRTEPRPYCPL